MSEITTVISLKALFSFPFRDRNWRKRFLVGALLYFAGFLIPIVPQLFVGGYILEVMRRALQGEELTLPAWEEWGKLGADGLRAMVVGLVFFLPGMVVLFGGMAIYFGASFSMPLAANPATDPSEVFAGMLLVLGSMAIMFISIAIGSILLLLAAIPWPLAMAHFVSQDKIGAAFRVREWWPLLKSNRLGYFIAWVIVVGLIGLFSFVMMIAYYSIVLCILIPFLGAPIGFYVALVGAALFGETYRESKAIKSAGQLMG